MNSKIVTVPGEEHAGQHAHQAAKDDQPLAVAFAIRTPGEELAHQNADHRATGKKEADHRRSYVNLVCQKQAQRWRLECPGDTRQEGDDQKGGRGEIKPASWQGGATVLHVGFHRFQESRSLRRQSDNEQYQGTNKSKRRFKILLQQNAEVLAGLSSPRQQKCAVSLTSVIGRVTFLAR